MKKFLYSFVCAGALFSTVTAAYAISKSNGEIPEDITAEEETTEGGYTGGGGIGGSGSGGGGRAGGAEGENEQFLPGGIDLPINAPKKTWADCKSSSYAQMDSECKKIARAIAIRCKKTYKTINQERWDELDCQRFKLAKKSGKKLKGSESENNNENHLKF